MQLKNELLRMIEAGVLEPGDDVAITLECQGFGIRYENGKKAFDALVAEGWLERTGPPKAHG
jgi:DNA-binding GntR family transcriptional regulator